MLLLTLSRRPGGSRDGHCAWCCLHVRGCGPARAPCIFASHPTRDHSRIHVRPQKSADSGNEESASGGRFQLRSVFSTVPHWPLSGGQSHPYSRRLSRVGVATLRPGSHHCFLSCFVPGQAAACLLAQECDGGPLHLVPLHARSNLSGEESKLMAMPQKNLMSFRSRGSTLIRKRPGQNLHELAHCPITSYYSLRIPLSCLFVLPQI